MPEKFLEMLTPYLLRVNPKNKGTLDAIDFGIYELLKRDDTNKGIELLEALLLAYPNDLSIELFDSSIYEIRSQHDILLRKLLTRWFLKGDMVLCNSIESIVMENLHLEVDRSELGSCEQYQYIFLAKKAIGYLFMNPVTVGSIIISLMRLANEDTIKQLAELLFHPLLLNFPGKLREYLVKQKEQESEQIEKYIDKALRDLQNYFDVRDSVCEIPELYSSQSQKEAYQRYDSRVMSISLKEASKNSFISSIASTAVLLYGRKTIVYVHGHDGQVNRQEMPLHSHKFSVEFPSLEYIDPFGIDYMLRIFRVERIKS